jgi:hypothetical protein
MKRKTPNSKLTQRDRLRIMRGISKVSSALLDFDAATDNYSEMSEQMKERINKFDKFFNGTCGKTLTDLVKADGEIAMSMLTEFNKSNSLVKIPECYERHIGIALSKIRSAFIDDFYNIENKDVVEMYRKRFMLFGLSIIDSKEFKDYHGPVLEQLYKAQKAIGLQIVSDGVKN